MEILVRTFLFFIILFLVIKLLGNKQIKQLTLYDYIIGITIGSIAADSIISFDIPIYYGMVSIFLFGIFGYVLALLTQHSYETEKMIEGSPIVLFQKDHFLEENLEKAKISTAQILEQCRLKGCFDIKDLDKAIMETSGEISILLKSDDYLKGKKESYTIILDGVINEEELKKAKKTKTWLKQYLKTKRKRLEDVTLLTIDQKGSSKIYFKK